MGKMSKREEIFWKVLVFFAGVMIGAMAYAILVPARTTKEKCSNGRSTQVQQGVEYKTYMPALDNCK